MTISPHVVEARYKIQTMDEILAEDEILTEAEHLTELIISFHEAEARYNMHTFDEILAEAKSLVDEVGYDFVRYLPDNMNDEDKCILFFLMYKAGILDHYLTVFAAQTNDGKKVENWYAVNAHDFVDLRSDVKIDPKTGRITSLCLECLDQNSEGLPFALPRIIECLQSLERIELHQCIHIPVELGNLPELKEIDFSYCFDTMFEIIPAGLHLPSVEKLTIFESELGSSMSSFLKIFSNKLEELWLVGAKRAQSDGILDCLQHNDDFAFKHSLRTIKMARCNLNEIDLERLMFEIRQRFTKLLTININRNDVRSLRGIENRIKRRSSSASSSGSIMFRDNNLRSLGLEFNPVLQVHTESNSVSKSMVVTNDPKEKVALLTIVDAFGISSLDLSPDQKYEPDVEHILRINHAGKKFIMEAEEIATGGPNNNDESTTIINHALWPKILERAYKKSYEIYNYYDWQVQEEKDRERCSSGMFHLVRHQIPLLLAEDHARRFRSYDDNKDSDREVKRKRKHST